MSTVFVLQFIPAQNSLSFSSHGIPGCRFPLNVPPPLSLEVSIQMCCENNFIELNCLALISQLLSISKSIDRLAQK